MAYFYTFKIKKGKFELEVTSENKYFIITQYNKLFNDFSKPPLKAENIEKVTEKVTDKAKKAIIEEKVQEEVIEKVAVKDKAEPEKVEEVSVEEVPQIEEPVETPKVVETKEKASKKQVTELEKEEKASIEEIPQIEEPVNEPEIAEETTIEEEEIVVEALEAEEPVEITEEESIEDPQEPEIEDEPQEPEEIDEPLYKNSFELEKKSKDDVDDVIEKPETKEFKDIIQEKMQDSEEQEEIPEPELEPISEDEAEEETIEKEIEEPEEETEKKNVGNSKVYDILQEKLASIPEEEKERLNLKREEPKQVNSAPKTDKLPNFLKFKTLEDLIYLKKPQTKLDYLLITSYYLQENEDTEKYSLKQINSLVVPHIKEPIDHSVIHEAVAHEYFEVVPDYLGTAGITEYKITEEGVDYLLNEL